LYKFRVKTLKREDKTMTFNINHLTPVIFGEGTSLETGKKLKERGIKKVFCVYDEGIKAAGVVDKIVEIIKAEDIQVVEFGGVLPDPPDTIVDQAGEIARKEEVETPVPFQVTLAGVFRKSPVSPFSRYPRRREPEAKLLPWPSFPTPGKRRNRALEDRTAFPHWPSLTHL
jgi:hypothetical protein